MDSRLRGNDRQMTMDSGLRGNDRLIRIDSPVVYPHEDEGGACPHEGGRMTGGKDWLMFGKILRYDALS